MRRKETGGRMLVLSRARAWGVSSHARSHKSCDPLCTDMSCSSSLHVSCRFRTGPRLRIFRVVVNGIPLR